MKRAWTIVGVVGVFVLVCLATPASAQVRGLGRVTGQVVDDGGAALAEVELGTALGDGSRITAKSDGSGNWTLTGMGRGEWTVLFKKAGYAPKNVKLVIERELDSNKPIKITLSKI